MFRTRNETSSGPRREVRTPGAAPGAPVVAAARRKMALFVAHGMGQQIPFETMDAVASGLARVAELNGRPVGTIRAATALVGGRTLQRIEMDLPDAGGNTIELHVYEGYWASVTEGQVNILDVISFLLRAGFNGLRNSWRDFHRWLFGGAVNFGRQQGTWLSLAVALAAVLSLIVANFVVTVLFAGRLAERVSPGAVNGAAFDDPAFTALTTLMAGWVIYSVVLGVLLLAAHRFKGGRWAERAAAPRRGLATALLAFLVALWVVFTIAIGVIPVLVLLGWMDVEGFGLQMFNTYAVAVWAALIAVSAVLRGMMIQFPGDVAAYISTHTLDRFQEIRSKIKEWVGSTAQAIYAASEYEGILWVGHSLGSVVVYDALNALIMADELDARRLRALERTRLLLTFGSPLDKIAFIFASQWANTTETREALAASFQPLILDYARYRRLRWVNIWSPADIVSGKLDFYDDLAKSDGREVVNLVDAAASTPLLAHIEYWRNRLLFEQLYEGLMGPAAGAQSAGAASSFFAPRPTFWPP